MFKDVVDIRKKVVVRGVEFPELLGFPPSRMTPSDHSVRFVFDEPDDLITYARFDEYDGN